MLEVPFSTEWKDLAAPRAHLKNQQLRGRQNFGPDVQKFVSQSRTPQGIMAEGSKLSPVFLASH
jgi:hypothetical protein